MIIEHVTDRNMTETGTTERKVSHMIDLQQALVADRIATLQREGAALRAERTRHRADDALPSRRVRIGRWLVSLGETISGAPAPDRPSLVHDGGGHDDSVDTWSHAA
jgi:hypothetical protein